MKRTFLVAALCAASFALRAHGQEFDLAPERPAAALQRELPLAPHDGRRHAHDGARDRVAPARARGAAVCGAEERRGASTT